MLLDVAQLFYTEACAKGQDIDTLEKVFGNASEG